MSDTIDPATGDRETAVGFLRHGADVLVVRRRDGEETEAGTTSDGEPDADASAAGPWDAIGTAAGDDPDAAIRRAVGDATRAAGDAALVRRGEPFRAGDDDGRRIHPFLFEFEGDRAAVEADPGAPHEWIQPTAIRERAAVPGLWTAWTRVAPTVGTVRADAEHGAAHLSLRALEVLRDRAVTLTTGGDDGDSEGVDPADGNLAALARALIAARPGMAVVATRIDRVMADADRSPAAVRARAEAALDAAVVADGEAARAAADRVRAVAEEPTVLTLSRSGTVRRALAAAEPAAVLVAESRPGGEGVGTAEALAGDTAVTLFADAAVAHVLGARDVDAVLVGADSVLPDGTVVNKVGTRTAARAAAGEGVPVYAVCSRDKVAPERPGEGPELVPRDPGELYDGDAPVAVENPTFDATPPDLVTGIATEDGVLESGTVAEVAADLRALRAWRDGDAADG